MVRKELPLLETVEEEMDEHMEDMEDSATAWRFDQCQPQRWISPQQGLSEVLTAMSHLDFPEIFSRLAPEPLGFSREFLEVRFVQDLLGANLRFFRIGTSATSQHLPCCSCFCSCYCCCCCRCCGGCCCCWWWFCMAGVDEVWWT